MDKEKLISKITTFILDSFKNETKILYKDIINFCLNNSDINQFLSHKKQPIIYIDNIIKYDNNFLKNLSTITQFYIVRAKHGIEFLYPLNNLQLHNLKFNQGVSKKILDNIIISDEIKNSLPRPYDNAIQKCRCAAKNKFNMALTNEVVFNVYLKGFQEIQHIIKYLDNFNDLYFVYKSNKIKIVKKQGNVDVCDMVLGTDLARVVIKDDIMIEYFNVLKNIYPFTHFLLLKVILFYYLIFKCENKDKMDYLNYLLLLNTEVTKNVTVIKYFSNCRFNRVFNQFYKDRLETLVSDQTDLMKCFLNNIKDLESGEDEFVSFIIGYYKIFTYIKNLFNREVKKLAQDYFHIKLNTVEVVGYDKVFNLIDSGKECVMSY